MERGTPCPGRTELRPVPALTPGPQSLSGDPGRPNAGRGPGGSRKRFLPRPWVGRPSSALLPAPLPCGGRSDKECGYDPSQWQKGAMIGPSKGLCLSGSPSM